MGAQRKFSIETEYLRHWAEYGYDLTVGRVASLQLAATGFDLCDVNFALRSCKVTRSDMLGSRGLWDVAGMNVDDIPLAMRVAVVSCENDVELIDVARPRVLSRGNRK